MTETKRHYIADEKLGGLEREYTEVDGDNAKQAGAGDYVHITKFDFDEVDELRKVTRLSSIAGDFYLDEGIDADYDDYLDGDASTYTTLSPTDIVRIDGARYRLSDRKAEVGERVVVIDCDVSVGWYADKIGSIHEVVDGRDYERPRSHGDGYTYVNHPDNNELTMRFIDDHEYLVLIPLDDAPTTDRADELSLIVELSQTVAQLQRELDAMSEVYEKDRSWTHHRINDVTERADSNAQDIRTWAEAHEGLRKEVRIIDDYQDVGTDRVDGLAELTEILIDDVAYLDERTQPLVAERSTEEVASAIRDLVDIQGDDGNWNYDGYMHGMYNGMELALSIVEGREPDYREAPDEFIEDLPENNEPPVSEHIARGGCI